MKRSATSELNRDNWDEEDEPEEFGRFKAVGKEELSKRVIKVAKRRLHKGSDEQKPLFGNFTAFGSQASSKASGGKSTFSFLSNLNGSSPQPSESNATSKGSSTESPTKQNSAESSSKEEENVYLQSIKTLNECLLDWLNKCVKKNPSCILSPIFKDYEKHIEGLSKPVTGNNESPKPSDSSSNFKFNFASNAGSQNTTTSPQITASNISSPLSTTSSLKNPSSSWLPPSSSLSKPNIFSSFASAPPALQTPLFGNVSNTSTPPTSETNKEAEDDDTPPVNDFKPVKEDDAIFSQKIKLFVQKDKQYTDRGVGTLYIKEAPGGTGKIYQAVVRADTSLGNVLLNIRLSGDIPSRRVGKNNVMLVCVPTPDSKPPPVPVLLRVKTAQEADLLLEEINKYK